MRDIVVILLVFGSLPLILRQPFFGVLVWAWLSYMNPHKLGWGLAESMPFAQIVAIVLLASIFLNNAFRRLPKSPVLTVWAMFLLWMCLSTAFAIYDRGATLQLEKVLKIQLLTFITIMLVDNQDKADKLIWVIALSIGFYCVKGGMFTLITGGAHHVFGPEGTFIEENNSLALATLMTIPLMVYLLHIEPRTWVKWGLRFAIFFSLVSVLGSQSRGAFLAIIAVAGFFWLKTRNKLVTGVFILIFAIIGYNLMPESWHMRMDTISNYEEDKSATGRLNAWSYSINLANDRLTGGGFNSWSRATFAKYAPDPTAVHAAHSIYFGVLGDHGWPGLILFLCILFMIWRSLTRVISRTADDEIREHQNFLAKMLQISLVAWMSGGAFLSLSYFDLPWHIIALALLLNEFTQSEDKPKLSRLPVKRPVPRVSLRH